MDSVMNKIEVIIVGGDHHNGLGLARIFGLNNIVVHAVIVDKTKKAFLSYSKYVRDCFVMKSEKDAFDFILEKYIPNNDKKYIIIPYSDGAAYELDNRLDEFSGYIRPSINNTQGALAKMMLKNEQYMFAKENEIKMAYTSIVQMGKDYKETISTVPYPCIIKPLISSEGDKKDIRICSDSTSLEKAIKEYESKGYSRALLQEYLTIDYEIDVFGCILKQAPYICQIPTKTIRAWPAKGGTNSFSQIITDAQIVEKCKEIIKKLANAGFYGLYDIELFVIDGDIWLNEINYRNSGDVYMGIEQKYYYPLAWVQDCLGIKVDISSSPMQNSYAMTECADLRNVIKGHVNIFTWIKEFIVCKDYALKFKGDMHPAYKQYMHYIRQFFKGKKM